MTHPLEGFTDTDYEPLPGPPSGRAAHGKAKPSLGSAIVGVIGELLLTAGVLAGLFVVYQVYWTDVIGGREAAAHIADFEKDLPPVKVDDVAPEHREEPPAETAPEAGANFAAMYVPRWGDGYVQPIAEGTTTDILNGGFVGHYEKTQLAGQVGNMAIAGHRQSHGKPFYGVDQLEPGDPIIVRTANAFYVYRVTSHQIVKPSDGWVIAPDPDDPTAVPTKRLLTLTTCHPLWSTKERWIVHAELDYWTVPDEGRPADLPAAALGGN